MYNESREVLIDWVLGNAIGLFTFLIIALVFKLSKSRKSNNQ